MTAPDQQVRERTLDVRESFLVQAPAGAGKTDLLTRRFLRLLAEVDSPERIVAITFTVAATTEMRDRILDQIARAARDPLYDQEATGMGRLAAAALENARRGGGNLFAQPTQLQIFTLDAFARRIAAAAPLTSRLAGELHPVKDAGRLYRQAARRTLCRMGGEDAGLNQALAALFRQLDGSFAVCEGLLSGMLRSREQWAELILAGELGEEARALLERPFREALAGAIERFRCLLAFRPGVEAALLELASATCGLGHEKAPRLLDGKERLPVEVTAEALACYQCLSGFLLTTERRLRKSQLQYAGIVAGLMPGAGCAADFENWPIVWPRFRALRRRCTPSSLCPRPPTARRSGR
jgi:hypothetical protein